VNAAKRAAAPGSSNGGNGGNSGNGGNGGNGSPTWPYVVGGLGAVTLVGGLVYWYYRKTTKRKELEESLLYLMAEQEEVS
jgi:hypothetical protein